MKKRIRITAFLLSLVMLLGLVPTSVFAADEVMAMANDTVTDSEDILDVLAESAEGELFDGFTLPESGATKIYNESSADSIWGKGVALVENDDGTKSVVSTSMDLTSSSGAYIDLGVRHFPTYARQARGTMDKRYQVFSTNIRRGEAFIDGNVIMLEVYFNVIMNDGSVKFNVDGAKYNYLRTQIRPFSYTQSGDAITVNGQSVGVFGSETYTNFAVVIDKETSTYSAYVNGVKVIDAVEIKYTKNANVTLENIVFLGDMVNVSSSGGSGEYWDFKGNIYFANPNDKSLSDVNMGAFKARAVFCFAEDNTSHLAEQTGKTSAPDCENAGMTYDICFCGQAFNKVEDVTAPALGHIYEQNKIVAITYADIAKNGTYTTNCDRCEHNEVAVKADSALFIYNGISTNGTGEMCVGYVINTDAISLYKQFNPEVTLDFGIVAAATDYIGENETPLDKDGNVVGTNVIKTELTGNTVRAVDFKLKGDFSLAENAKLNLTMGMYVILNGKVSYIYNSATDGKNEASCNDSVKITTYEALMNY